MPCDYEELLMDIWLMQAGGALAMVLVLWLAYKIAKSQAGEGQ